jgi:excisionase family DNA binding protein
MVYHIVLNRVFVNHKSEVSEMNAHQNIEAGRRVGTINEAARMLGISRGSAYEAAKRGEIPTIRIGRRLLVPLAALERMLGSAAPCQ